MVIPQLPGHHFGDAVAGLVGQAGDPAHIPNHPTGGHSAEGDNLGHMVGAVPPGDVVDDLLAALLAEVDVKVRHGHPLRVQNRSNSSWYRKGSMLVMPMA